MTPLSVGLIREGRAHETPKTPKRDRRRAGNRLVRWPVQAASQRPSARVAGGRVQQIPGVYIS